MKKILKKLLAPLIREVVKEELKTLNQQVLDSAQLAVSNLLKNVKFQTSDSDSSK